MEIFRCLTYSFIDKKFREKFDAKSKKGYFAEIQEESYKVWLLEENKIKFTSNVKFDKTKAFDIIVRDINELANGGGDKSTKEIDEVQQQQDLMRIRS